MIHVPVLGNFGKLASPAKTEFQKTKNDKLFTLVNLPTNTAVKSTHSLFDKTRYVQCFIKIVNRTFYTAFRYTLGY